MPEQYKPKYDRKIIQWHSRIKDKGTRLRRCFPCLLCLGGYEAEHHCKIDEMQRKLLCLPLRNRVWVTLGLN